MRNWLLFGFSFNLLTEKFFVIIKSSLRTHFNFWIARFQMAELYNPNSLPADFVKFYGGTEDSVKIFSSPARINIIGEHIDYNGGKVYYSAQR